MLYRIYREGSISQESLSRIVEFSYTLFPGESFILMLTESNRKQDGMNFDDDLDLLIAERDKLNRFHTILESPGYRCLSLVSGGDSTELNNLLDSIDRKLFSGFTGEVTLSCSRSFKGLDSLSEHFGELKISRTGKLFGSPSPLLKPELSGGIRTVPPGHIPDENMILFSRLELSLARRDYAVCREELNRITKRWTEINDKRCKYMFLSGAFERLEKGFNDHFGKMEQPLKLEDFQSPAHLFDYLNERLDEGEKDDISRESRIIYRAKEFIHEHYAETVDMAALAEELNISYSYFSTLFRRTCSMTFLDYLGAYRMDIASRLLKETSLPVQSIAERVGYTHSRHFSRAFRKYTGRSPSEYRAY